MLRRACTTVELRRKWLLSEVLQVHTTGLIKRKYAVYTEVMLDVDDENYNLFRKQQQHFKKRKRELQWRSRKTVKYVPLYAEMYMNKEPTNKSISTMFNVNQDDTDLLHSNIKKSYVKEEIDELSTLEVEIEKQLEKYFKEDNIEIKKLSSVNRLLSKKDTAEREQALHCGTPDPNEPISNVPCPGCGANLHCQNPGIPGYMSSEKFKKYMFPKENLKKYECQRCFLMTHYNLALNASLSAKDYHNVIAKVKDMFALVIVVVDLTDFPNSIYKRLLKLIGNKHPIFIVANKIDLIPKDADGYLQRIKASVEQAVSKQGLNTGKNIKHICLVSAKTGYGIEELITKLMKDWNRKGDVCVVGCTNAGKSTLYNALLASDYCKADVRDLIHRATTSVWPGTTLNLLKFPIFSATPWRMYLRSRRLLKDRQEWAEERRLKHIEERGKENVRDGLMYNVGITFVDETRDKFDGIDLATFDYDSRSGALKEVEFTAENLKETEDVIKDGAFPKSKWCYDTPGVVNPEQVINLLTQEELSSVIPQGKLPHRTLTIQRHQVVFIGGLGRIDYIEGPNDFIHITVFSSPNLPISVLYPNIADGFYQRYLYNGKLVVPRGNEERLDQFPSLVGKEFTLTGLSWTQSAADILISSAGWVSVTAARGALVKLRAYTPGGCGCYLRQPALLPYAVQVKGKRIDHSSAFQLKACAVE